MSIHFLQHSTDDWKRCPGVQIKMERRVRCLCWKWVWLNCFVSLYYFYINAFAAWLPGSRFRRTRHCAEFLHVSRQDAFVSQQLGKQFWVLEAITSSQNLINVVMHSHGQAVLPACNMIRRRNWSLLFLELLCLSFPPLDGSWQITHYVSEGPN